MINNFQDIWTTPSYLPYVQPKLTDIILKEAEEQLGYKLPVELIELLKSQNGGYINMSIPGSPHNVISGIGPYFPSLLDFDFEEIEEYVSYSLKGLIPFDGDGHWYLCLDYRENNSSPYVTFIDIECDEQELIAKSFSEYLSKLEMQVDDKYVIEGIDSIETTLSKLSRLLKSSFPTPDYFDHGYPIYRAKLGNDDNPEWIWVSPNIVPNGFVRENDKRYNELKLLVTNKKERYTKLPEHSYIVSFTEGVTKEIFEAFSTLNLELKELSHYYLH